MIKKIEVIVHTKRLEKFKIITIGRINAISTSKIKKIIAIKKNRRENGIREELIGSNPHSKGELFSRSKIDFLDKIEAKAITTMVINRVIRAIKKIEKIIYTKLFSPHDWKSCILNILYKFIYLINK